MTQKFQFPTWMVIGCLFILLSVGTINWSIDPHSYFGHNTGSVYVDNDRYLKRVLAVQGNFDALLLGSSKVAAIDPDDISREGLKFFNAGLLAAAPEDMLFLLEDIADNQKLALIGFDFFMFNSTAEPYRKAWHQDAKALGPWYQYLFSISTLQASLSNAYDRMSGKKPLVFQDGQRNPENSERIDSAFYEPAYDKVLHHVRAKSYGHF